MEGYIQSGAYISSAAAGIEMPVFKRLLTELVADWETLHASSSTAPPSRAAITASRL
jgi:hypothetical protein